MVLDAYWSIGDEDDFKLFFGFGDAPTRGIAASLSNVCGFFEVWLDGVIDLGGRAWSSYPCLELSYPQAIEYLSFLSMVIFLALLYNFALNLANMNV